MTGESFRQTIASHWVISGMVLLVLLVLVAFASLVIAMGLYNVAADEPHSRPVYWLMQTVRNRSIAASAQGVVAPTDLYSPKRIAAGAGLYADMCSQCHLAPGMEKTEISQGLYPGAPELARGLTVSPAEKFWAIKHGIKMTAMPAWGRTHNDTLIWDMVAFIEKLPSLTAVQYREMVKNAPGEHEEMMKQMPGMGDKDHHG